MWGEYADKHRKALNIGIKFGPYHSGAYRAIPFGSEFEVYRKDARVLVY